jgi:hypothetical protein
MRTVLALCLLFAACDKEETVPPAPIPQPVVCCPSEAPEQFSPGNNATLSAPIAWRWRSVEGAARYAIEARCDWTGPGGQNYSAVLLSTTTTDTDDYTDRSSYHSRKLVRRTGPVESRGPWKRQHSRPVVAIP